MGIPELGKDALIEIFMKCQSFCALRNEMKKRETAKRGREREPSVCQQPLR